MLLARCERNEMCRTAMQKTDFVRNHPIRAGLCWAAFVFSGALALNVIFSGKLPDNLASRLIVATLAGIAWGYAMRWWYQRARRDTR